MIPKKHLLLEKFELSSDLQKQLEDTTYSALGYLLNPQIKKYKKLRFRERKINEKSIDSIKEIGKYLNGFASNKIGDMKITLDIQLVSNFYLYFIPKSGLKKFKLNIEKNKDTIYVESGNSDVFPNMTIERDPAGWNLKPYNDYYKRKLESFDEYNKSFETSLVDIEQIDKLTESWKKRDIPDKTVDKFSDVELNLQYKKQSPDGALYKRYFRLIKDQNDTFSTPNAFFAEDPPYILQTINIVNFIPPYSVDWFIKNIKTTINTSLHEGRHLQQYIGNIKNRLGGDLYGGPKSKLRYSKNIDVRGINPMGQSSPTSKVKSDTDVQGRVLHPFRDVEFKTNLYDYKSEIERFLSDHFIKKDWGKEFKNLLLYIIGKNPEYIRGRSFDYTRAKRDLKALYDYDRPKFNEMVRELYKLMFL